MYRYLLLIVGVICVGNIAAASETPIDIFDKTPKFKDAKVESGIAARVLADKQYVLKFRDMESGVLATEGVRSVSIIKLGYNIPDFAKKGEKLWEVRILLDGEELRSIIWINPTTAKVRFVSGPWEEEADKK